MGEEKEGVGGANTRKMVDGVGEDVSFQLGA